MTTNTIDLTAYVANDKPVWRDAGFVGDETGVRGVLPSGEETGVTVEGIEDVAGPKIVP